MLKAIFNWFRKPAPESLAPAVKPEAAPYKVEAPAPVVPVAEPKPVSVAPAAPKAAPKKPAAKKPAAKKPAAMKVAKKKPAK